ncbi:hypothetical protein ASPACDRAFT_48596 [Aspergillus aculeatus ATCC 16872]|uniref:Uncharacterized protein n=1 Tax=Aspergillus aculeatus (strain ATCC 16872 / CBS 172.66 / WB 5094) TaxID=690307 RepID=A0A1L9WET8_ASPA1|nr:uncharacterized protein ASPACDRAFT_48596 [Aspergillus aculeatus ATCC 16872]OJJ94689.1 hypothetical protein ASPACDRAFT_48596 [Aspergillus aculeatus ATCC 16872]
MSNVNLADPTEPPLEELYMNLLNAPPGIYSPDECPMPTGNLTRHHPSQGSTTTSSTHLLHPQSHPLQRQSPTSSPSLHPQQNPSDLSSLCCPAHERIVHLLLQRGANVDMQNSRGQTPLHLAAQRGHLGIVRLLLMAPQPVDVNARDRFGSTPLHLASENGHVEVVRLLVAHHARVDVRSTRE